jgi:hypothetical protein
MGESPPIIRKIGYSKTRVPVKERFNVVYIKPELIFLFSKKIKR